MRSRWSSVIFEKVYQILDMLRIIKRWSWLAIGCCTLLYISFTKDYKISKPLIDTMDVKTIIRPTKNNLRYILIWTNPLEDPILYLKEARYTFIKRMCPVSNCYVTSKRGFFEDITDFDVIIFHGKEITRRLPVMPKTRSIHQKYIFANMESSDYYPICDTRFDGYFNWTWTYKLNSDEYYGYISIRDNQGNIVGPKTDMQWLRLEDMDPVNETIKEKIMHKRKIAAWFVSNCEVPSRREQFVNEIQQELEYYGLAVDIYGECGTKQCPRNQMDDCLKLIAKDYYFYFSFENSFSEDYVTEKLLHALNNYAIPVVFGAANYTRYFNVLILCIVDNFTTENVQY